ncbi:MAG: hypothetical protein U1G08_06010 [Verrucomicrobiota bacterium]
MSWAAAQKRIEAARKREERAALKRQRELTRILKEEAMLSAQEQARMEVEAFENSIEVLLSIHKEAGPSFDWLEVLCALPPHAPFNGDTAHYEKEREEFTKMRSLAKQVLAGEASAYTEVIREFSPLGELSTLGSSITLRVHTPKLIECDLLVNGRDVIPREIKALTAAGSLSVKTMPKVRFHEIYQDYVCGCVLRVAREVFALLPVDTVIITAKMNALEESTGDDVETPILSVAVPRLTIGKLNFLKIDPSDSMKNFLHRGDVLAARKAQGFVAIKPLVPAEVAECHPAQFSLPDLLVSVRRMRSELLAEAKVPTFQSTNTKAS